ncbi:MAG: hypothetical protein HC936_12000 [Leptolyngbyaceae cyanobacterium SU_3_3]|nr:hypothetical protein [Leptolyngbyaceae cyanobacterium SU_3_3]
MKLGNRNRPPLDGTTDVATVSRTLVEIANTRNGHDNVTIGLVYCQVDRQANAERSDRNLRVANLPKIPQTLKPRRVSAHPQRRIDRRASHPYSVVRFSGQDATNCSSAFTVGLSAFPADSIGFIGLGQLIALLAGSRTAGAV